MKQFTSTKPLTETDLRDHGRNPILFRYVGRRLLKTLGSKPETVDSVEAQVPRRLRLLRKKTQVNNKFRQKIITTNYGQVYWVWVIR